MATAIAPTRLTSATGARIEDVDLRALDGPAVEQLLAALHEHGVLVLPGQDLSAEDQLAFTARLGEVHAHPVREFLVGGGGDPISIVENDADKPPQGDGSFHVDYSFAPEVPDLAVLRAEVLPPRGVDTVWANAGAAYDALSPHMQEFLAGLTARHDAGEKFWFELRRTLGEEPAQKARDHFDGTSHPVVAAHPVTGRPLLFVNPGYTVQINELGDRESAGILRLLFEHLGDPAFHYKHLWQAGDVVIWDEHLTTHMGPSDFYPAHRRLVRVTAGQRAPVPHAA
jgi:taurine dioxygenase